MRMRYGIAGIALGLALLLAGCPAARPPEGGGGSGSSGKLRLSFWHTRRGSQEKLLREICAEYNRSSPRAEIVPEYQGDYDDLNKKLRASIQARSLPALSVAYESHVTEYMANGVVRPLDDLVSDPELGLSAKELADIPEVYLSSNRFPQFGNRLLSFPFTKSHLVMYYNRTLLREAGFAEAPKTWPEFERQAEAITRRLGRPAFPFDLDPSTLDGMIYSHGGELLEPDGIHTRFDEPPTVRTFQLLQRMARAGTLTEAAGDELGSLFAGRMAAFVLGSSSGRANTEQLVGDRFDWDVAPPPHAEGVRPVTVMYGPNVCIFRASPEQEREAWKFVRYFTSPPVTARWSRETGYLPVRRSAVELPEMKAFFRENPRAWNIYRILPLARGEPNVVGWQEVRKHLQEAARSVIAAGTPPEVAAANLKRKADRALAQSRQ